MKWFFLITFILVCIAIYSNMKPEIKEDKTLKGFISKVTEEKKEFIEQYKKEKDKAENQGAI